MLVGLIKERNNNYYVNFNSKEVSVIHSYKNTARVLSKEEASSLLTNLLDSKMTFNQKVNGYDVYFDEANNKRFFKDGKEDLNLFFINNGIEAKEYDEEDEILDDDIEKQSPAKKFLIKHGTKLLVITGFAALFLTIKLFPRLKYTVMEYFYNGEEMSPSYAKELINDSNNIESSDKELLYNEALFEDVFDIAEQNRDYELKTKLSDLEVEYYNKDSVEGGYYLDLEPNVIHIKEEYKDLYLVREEVLYHEFIHLLQTNNRYHYINEAVAEIMASEYYNISQTTYKDRRIRTKILMEIIGPNPILNCCFNTDNTLFEDSIREYLTDNETDRLLSLLTTSSTVYIEDKDEEKRVSNEIDILLAKMYNNKYKKDIKDDKFIMYLYKSDDTRNTVRAYFNKRLGSYYKTVTDLRLYDDSKSLDDFIKSGSVKKYIFRKKELVNEEEFNNIMSSPVSNVSVRFFNELIDEDLYRNSDKNIEGTLYVKVTTIEATDLNDIEKGNYVTIVTNDDEEYDMFYNKDKTKQSNPHRYIDVVVNEPSIYEKFVKNNENVEGNIVENTTSIKKNV